MSTKNLQKIAGAFVKSKGEKNARGCYITPDGTVFYRDYMGLQYARAHAGDPNKVSEYNENAELVTPQDPSEERQNLIAKITESPTNSYGVPQLANMSNEGLRKLWLDLSNPQNQQTQTSASSSDSSDEGEVNLDRMNKIELIELLGDLDPTREVTRETKAQLKDLIVSANTLDGYGADKLVPMIGSFDPELERVQLDLSDDEVVNKFDEGELKAIVLFLRDGVDLEPELDEKMHSLGEIGSSEDDEKNNGGSEDKTE